MDGPVQGNNRTGGDEGEKPPLFQSTSQIAGQQAALKSGSWRKRILDRLRARPSALFEVATFYGVPDHTISGRFTELAKDGYIERTGERRTKPLTDCPADVWRVAGAAAAAKPDLPELLGYPLTLVLDNELYDRQELLPSEGYPGIPYARRADTGGQKLLVRVELIECPGCGRALKFVAEGGVKKFRCGTAGCDRTWEAAIVGEPGKGKVMALVMKAF